MRDLRVRARRVLALSAAGALAAPLLIVPAGASAAGAAAAAPAAGGGKVRAKAAAAPSPYVQDSSAAVAVTSAMNKKKGHKKHKKRLRSKVAVSGSSVTLTLSGVSRAVIQERQGVAEVLRKDVTQTWARLGGSPTGVVSGWTDKGARVAAPVVFGKATYQRAKRKLVVAGRLPAGKLDPLSKQYVPWVADATASLPAGSYRQLGIVGFPKDSRTFKWSAAGKGTTKFTKGGSFTVSLAMSGAGNSGIGVQRGGQVASVPWKTVADNAAKFIGTGGVAPRLVVDSASKKRSAVAVLAPEKLSVSGSNLVISGKVPPRTPGGKRAVPSARSGKLAVSLETSGVGVDTSYVVITGDSIASGEGASYAGTYINPTLGVTPDSTKDDEDAVSSWLLAELANTNNAQVGDALGNMARGLVEFCKKIDLACTKAELDGSGKVVYQRDPGKVYEKGSWEKADAGQACHRSKTAPGTWLARYYSTQMGLKVESINLACSGATTADILKNSFKGERPQREDLRALADWLPVTHVTNTIGANDIGFNDIAVECFFAPINALLPGGLSGGLSLEAIQGAITAIVDDVVAAPDGKLASVNPNFNPATLCSQKERATVRARLTKVRGDVADVLRALHEAAPDAQIVQSNYPSLVPASTHTYLPRQELWSTLRNGLLRDSPADYWSKVGDCERALKRPDGQQAAFLSWCQLSKEERNQPTTVYRELLTFGTNANGDNVALFPQGVPATSDLWPGGTLPAGQPNPDLAQGAIEGNVWNKLIMDNFWAFSYNVDKPSAGQQALLPANGKVSELFQNWLFFQKPLIDLLSYGSLLFGPDTDWAAEEVIAGLNSAVDGAVTDVDPKGDFITPVDMTQAFNGREFGGKFTGHEMSPAPVVLGYGKGEKLEANWDTATPANSRAQFVTTLFAGQTLPYLCPGGKSGLDIVAGASGPKCVGDYQENLHPNWRGQAAEGQCIVAVVTRAYGQGGNACVRSVGADNGAQERNYPDTADKAADASITGTEPVLFSKTTGTDTLCLTSLEAARKAAEAGRYLTCTSKAPADPTWDTEKWNAGKVTDGSGKKVAWR